MAKVQFGAGISALSGSIGGWTFHTNRSGNIVRLRGGTFKSKSIKQTDAIAKHISLLNGFNALSAANKLSWDAFANAHTKEDKFGQIRTITGQNWYEAINSQRETLTLSRLDVPPMFQGPIGNTNFSLVVDATKIEVTKNPPTSPNNTSLLWWASPPLRRTTNSIQSSLRFIQVDRTQPFTVIDLTASWVSAFKCPWPPSPNAADFNIFIGLQIVRESSGLTDPINFQSAPLVIALEGVGFQIIGSTNVIG